MRAPLTWLRDFAPFEGDPADLAAVLDDLGLVVEGVERVGEGLGDVVVARIDEITAIEGADRIRRVVVDAGAGPVQIVCGAMNFSVGDLVPLAPVGTVLPGDFAITERKMRGVVSHGMLCSGQELGLPVNSAAGDGDGLMILTDLAGAAPGRALVDVLGIEPDVVFDITVEGNRPDAWCMAGVARDLAARLGLPFRLPEPPPLTEAGPPVGERATVVVEDPELCPRFTARLLSGVTVKPSPEWIARRLTLAGMRPINNVVDASNYVMLELGQPNHPYDFATLPGGGLRVRAARPGETLVTLDGAERRLGIPGPGLGDTGVDCLICDAEGTPVGLGGIMGGSSSEITEATTDILLEVAYFTPMVVARTSKRLALRTEASARFERGTDPWVLELAASRFCELLGASVPGLVAASGTLDARGAVPEPVRLDVSVEGVERMLGVGLDAEGIAGLLSPLGFECAPSEDRRRVSVVVPTNRPDVRPAPEGEADVIEEVARIYGYSRVPRRQPAWPQVGRMTSYQRERRLVRQVALGIGASEAWTTTFLAPGDHERVGLEGPAVQVANPLVSEESVLRRSLLPGLLQALVFNADRRSGPLRLFEVGTVFSHPDEAGRPVDRAGAGGRTTAVLPGERELLSVAFAGAGDDARTAVAGWQALAEALRLGPVRLVAEDGLAGLHPTRSAALVIDDPSGQAGSVVGAVIGVVGEVDPAVVADVGLAGPGMAGLGPAGSGVLRVGWLEVDLGLLLDGAVTPRLPELAQSVSRFPSSDLDLAFVAPDDLPADRLADRLAKGAGELLESISLFDVYRGPGVTSGSRSLAYRLRLVAMDRTLTEGEIGAVRDACIREAAEVGATLR